MIEQCRITDLLHSNHIKLQRHTASMQEGQLVLEAKATVESGQTERGLREKGRGWGGRARGREGRKRRVRQREGREWRGRHEWRSRM